MISSFVLLCIGIIFKIFQPKKFNALLSYRTAASKRTANTWRFANEYAAMWLVRIALILCIAALICMEFSNSYPLTELIIAALSVLGFVIVFVKTEAALKKYASRIDSNNL